MSVSRSLKGLAIASTLALAAIAAPIAVIPAQATVTCTASPTNWNDLMTAVNGSLGSTFAVCLGANITGPVNDTANGGHIDLPPNSTVTIDLAGHTLSVTAVTMANNTVPAGITVPQSTSLIIEATGGGTLNSTGAASAGAGIGGNSNPTNTPTHHGPITINGGIINAVGGRWGAGIGGGTHSWGGDVTINGGTVTATGGTGPTGSSGAAGIGGGWDSPGGNVTITGGTVHATGGDTGPGFGGGWGNYLNSFTMTGGTVTAVGGAAAPGLATGFNASGSFTVSGGTLTATGNSTNQWNDYAGIMIAGTTNSISGGTITAIGAGSYDASGMILGDGSSSVLEMTDGSLTSTGFGALGAGIGTRGTGVVKLPSASGTVLTAGSGFGTGAATHVPVQAVLPTGQRVFSMTGTRDATASQTAQTVIVFSAASNFSSGGSSSSGSSGSQNSGSSSGSSSGTTSAANETAALATTGFNMGILPIAILTLAAGTLLLLWRRRATLS